VRQRSSHRLVAYRAETELLAHEWEVPPGKLATATRIAHVPPSDPEAVGNYRLSEVQARDLAGVLGLDLPPDRLLYYLEPACEDD
jgi:hypothetical protein